MPTVVESRDLCWEPRRLYSCTDTADTIHFSELARV